MRHFGFVKMLILIAFISTVAASAAMGLLRSDFMSLSDASKRWGEKPFVAEQFRKGDEKTRASMAASLIHSKKYIGKTVETVLSELGDPDGYYFSETVPAYVIERKSKPKEVWQLVFLPDSKKHLIEEVKIHKNCCYE